MNENTYVDGGDGRRRAAGAQPAVTDGRPWALRAVQLDLGRQMETPDFIRQFIDFAGRFGYNAVLLYLEARIRTKSFPYPPRDQSYSPDEIRDLVAHAARGGLDLIPCVSTLGHVENFLQYPPLRPFSEMRETGRSAFDATPMTFCPSRPETRRFLEAYLTEVAALFPSPYFHIGCDEVWDFGYCPDCRARMAKGASYAELFADHIRFSHAIVAGKLGKRVLMWDDMLEPYPEALDRIPADIIQVVWQYNGLVEKCRSHFGPVRWDDRMAQYRARGIEYLIGPGPGIARNGETLTAYARRFAPLGGLMTSWEHAADFMFDEFPNIAFCGRRWNRPDLADGKLLWRETAAELFGLTDPAFLDALWAVQNQPYPKLRTDVAGYLRGPVTDSEFETDNHLAVAEATLASFAGRLRDDLARAVLDDMLLGLRLCRLRTALRAHFQRWFLCWRGHSVETPAEIAADGRAILAAIAAARDERARQWSRWRPGLVPRQAEARLQALHDNLRTFLDDAEAGRARTGLLSVKYFLPDFYSAQSGRWLVQYAGETGWEQVYQSQPKPDRATHSEYPLYCIESLLNGDKTPARLRFESWGYGGVGLRYVEVCTPHGVYVPARVENRRGKIADPEHLAENDTQYCYLGEADTHRSFMNRALAEEVHSLELVLERADNVDWRGLTRRDPAGFVG